MKAIEPIVKETKIYLDKMVAVALPKELVVALKENHWKHTSDVYAIYDAKEDRIIIRKTIMNAVEEIKKLKMPQAFGLTLINQKNTQAV